MKIQCYNCGKYFGKKEITKEHIPAQTMFAGYGDKYKLNRITVPSCYDCNQSYMKDDEEFRNLIGMINNEKERKIISEKAVRSIIRNDKELKRLVVDTHGNKCVSFDYQKIDKYHIKNFKGVFYKEFGYAISDKYHIISETKPNEKNIKLFYLLIDKFKWKKSGHEDIFKYIIQPFDKIIESNNNINDKIILAYLEYNKSHTAIVIATDKEILKQRM